MHIGSMSDTGGPERHQQGGDDEHEEVGAGGGLWLEGPLLLGGAQRRCTSAGGVPAVGLPGCYSLTAAVSQPRCGQRMPGSPALTR